MSSLRVVGPEDSAIFMPREIVMRAVDELLPFAMNSRLHTPASTATLAGMIQKFGWTNPVLIADGGILAGHGRILAAKKLGLARVPCIDLSHLGPDERRALVIADNRSSELSGWSLEELKAETDYLRSAGFDLEADVGFSEESLAALLEGLTDEKPTAESDPDAVPELPAEPVSRQGDCWVMGAHRIACADCRQIESWDLLMQGALADACWTDPPFNVDLGRKNRLMDGAVGGKRAANGDIANDKMSADEFRELLAGAYSCIFEVLKPGSAIYVAHADKVADVFRAEFEKAGFHFSQLLIWNKGHHVIGMADFQPAHESIAYGWKPGSKHRWHGGRKQKTVIELGAGGPISQAPDGRWLIKVGDTVLIVSGEATVEEAPSTVIFEPKPAASGLHPSTKPVALVERLLKNNARPGDIVVDAFSGSGSTIIAADRLGMCARVMDISPKYVDVAVRRWEQYTGRRAIHALSGVEFPRDGEQRRDGVPADHHSGVDDDHMF